MNNTDEQPKGTGNGFLRDSENKKSSMRLMCMFSFWGSIYFGTLMLAVKPPVLQYVFLLACSCLLGAFAPKAVQKFMERKIK